MMTDAGTRAHVLTRLGLKIQSNTSPLLLIPPPSPPSLPLPHQALWAQVAFEELNVPALSLLPTPLASMYALGVTSGIVLHVGRDRSEIAIVTDSIMRWECSTTVQVGYADCEEWFQDLLMNDAELDTMLKSAAGTLATWSEGQKEKLVKEVASVIWNECTGEDLEVTPADGGAKLQAALAAPLPEDDSSFDVAKKYVSLAQSLADYIHEDKLANWLDSSRIPPPQLLLRINKKSSEVPPRRQRPLPQTRLPPLPMPQQQLPPQKCRPPKPTSSPSISPHCPKKTSSSVPSVIDFVSLCCGARHAVMAIRSGKEWVARSTRPP